MDGKELNLNNECKGDGFIDRSKVRILLCDNDSKSLDEICTLLLKCSYQVTSVRSARQVIDALNAEGPDIDIILAELDLPMAKGFKMLKYITRDKDLQRIPVIMMSPQDEVSVVVKCLKLGAADYLVKPLRTNELLNLWTHMWRRRRMLGMAEKNLLSYDFDHVASDPSDANTNSTTLFSDDTDDKSRRSTNPDVGSSVIREEESAPVPAAYVDGTVTSAATAVAALGFPPPHLMEFRPDIPAAKDRRTGQFPCGPKKSELKIGESSAFFTYVKSTVLNTNGPGVPSIDENGFHHSGAEENVLASSHIIISETQMHDNGWAYENNSRGDELHGGPSVPNSLEQSCTPPTSTEFHQGNYIDENLSRVSMNPRNGSHISGVSAQTGFRYYMPGVMNQVMMPTPGQIYPKNVHDFQGHVPSTMVSQYRHMPQCPPHINGMAPFPYYPVDISLQQGQISAVESWPSVGGSSSAEIKPSKVNRREAALIKFRQKRKERCFDKKIRYVNRKKLAERRPRVRGQFVRKVNGVNVDLNGQPDSADYDEDEDEEEEGASRDSSPEDDAL